MEPKTREFYVADDGNNLVISVDFGEAVRWLKAFSLDDAEITKFERDAAGRWTFSPLSWKTICKQLVGGEER